MDRNTPLAAARGAARPPATKAGADGQQLFHLYLMAHTSMLVQSSTYAFFMP